VTFSNYSFQIYFWTFSYSFCKFACILKNTTSPAQRRRKLSTHRKGKLRFFSALNIKFLLIICWSNIMRNKLLTAIAILMAILFLSFFLFYTFSIPFQASVMAIKIWWLRSGRYSRNNSPVERAVLKLVYYGRKISI
jgi:hypothetical protein